MFKQNLDYFRDKPLDRPKTTILLDNSYHPERIRKELEKIYPEIMDKIQFELSPKPSKQEKLAQCKTGFVPVKARWVVERSNAWVERCKSLGTPLTGGTSSRNTPNCTTYRSAPSNIRIIAANPGDDCNSVDYTSGTSSITLPTQATMYCVDTGATFPSGSTAKGLLTLSGNTFVSGVFQSSSGTPLIVPAVPTAPSSFTATVVSTAQIDLSWTDNSSDETGFKIEQPAGTLVTTTAANATSYSHTGLTCGTTYNYTLKATNANGDSSSITASATTNACTVQTITGFVPVNSATYGDSPITLSATGGASGNAVSFASTTASVCSVTGSTLSIIGVGTCTVTVDQAGNASYSAASQVSQDITVAKKSITAQVDNKTRLLNVANPTFTISYTGLVNGDSNSVISTPPTASTTATVASALGSYPITCDNSSSSATNYIISTCADGNLIVSKATPSMTLTSAAPLSTLGTPITVNFTVTGTPTPTGLAVLSRAI
ncbi:MAG: MBG domain-containing protein [Thiotrichaceae bacterium]|nr:MBG domain-containing protein [Thiotrichaceae bacterium]